MDTGKRFGTIVVRHRRHAGAVRAIYTFPGRMTQRDENGGVNALKANAKPADIGESSKSDVPEHVAPVPASAPTSPVTQSDSGTAAPAAIARMISSWDAMTRVMFLTTLPADLRHAVVMELAHA